MKNPSISLVAAAAMAFIFGQAHGEPSCKAITQTGAATLSSQDCYASGILGKLYASGQFPDIFAAKKYVFQGLPSFVQNTVCFASDGSFTATIGGVPVTIQAFSVWTNSTKPVIFSLRGLTDTTYTDTLGEVISQFTVTDPTGKYNGKIFSRDIIDLGHAGAASAKGENAVVGGTKNFSGAKGTFKMQLDAVPTPPATVPISKLNGVICADKNSLPSKPVEICRLSLRTYALRHGGVA